MGNFLGTVYVRTDDRAAVLGATQAVCMRRPELCCYVAPTINGWTAVLPNNSGQDETVSADLAGHIAAPLLHTIVHDDDVLIYFLYREGKLVTQWNSKPGYFGDSPGQDPPARPDATVFAEFLRRGATVRKVEQALWSCADAGMVSEFFQTFAELLRLPNPLVSYEYFEEPDLPVKGRREFVHVPARESPKEKAKRQRAAHQQVMARLKADGLLIAEPVKTPSRVDGFPIWCADPPHGGILVAWFAAGWLPGVDKAVVRWSPPWKKGQTLAVVAPASTSEIFTSADGKTISLVVANMAGGQVLRVHDAATGALLSEGPYRWADQPREAMHGRITRVSSPDGRYAVYGETGGLTVHDLESGKLSTRPLLHRLSAAATFWASLGREFQGQARERLDRVFEGPAAGTPSQHELFSALNGGPRNTANVLVIVRQLQALGIDAPRLAQIEQWLKENEPLPAEMTRDVAIQRISFSPDGGFLLVGLAQRLIVCRWEQVLADEFALATPAKCLMATMGTFNICGTPIEQRGSIGGWTFDVPHHRVLFCDTGVGVRCMDLSSFRTGVVLRNWNEHPAIWTQLLAGGEALVVQSQFSSERGGSGPYPISVWNYPALCERMTWDS